MSSCTVDPTTEYFDTFSDLLDQYNHLLNLDWSEFNTLLTPGLYATDVEIDDLYDLFLVIQPNRRIAKAIL